MRLSAPSATSSTWSGGDRLLSALAQGPHHLDFSLHDAGDEDDDGDMARSRAMMEGTGTTWPPVGALQGGPSSWWSTMRQIQVLSVLELERQIGLPRSLSSRGSLNTEGSASHTSSPRRQDGVPATFGGDDDGAARSHSATSFEGLEPREGEELLSLRPSGQSSSSFLSGDSNDAEVGSERNSLSSYEDSMPDIPFPRAEDAQAAQAVENVAADAPPEAPAAEGASTITMPAADAFLFDALFNLHPFAAAAFLRAFIACSFGLMLFHVHTFMSWPDHGSCQS